MHDLPPGLSSALQQKESSTLTRRSRPPTRSHHQQADDQPTVPDLRAQLRDAPMRRSVHNDASRHCTNTLWDVVMAWIEKIGQQSWRVRFRRADGTTGS